MEFGLSGTLGRVHVPTPTSFRRRKEILRLEIVGATNLTKEHLTLSFRNIDFIKYHIQKDIFGASDPYVAIFKNQDSSEPIR